MFKHLIDSKNGNVSWAPLTFTNSASGVIGTSVYVGGKDKEHVHIIYYVTHVGGRVDRSSVGGGQLDIYGVMHVKEQAAQSV
jgi:hypothetical protein